MMRIGGVVFDTDNMTLKDVDTLIKELRAVRLRKARAHDCRTMLRNAVSFAKEEGMTLCSRMTGEVLNPDDWYVYDEQMHCTHGEEVDE